MNNEFLRQYKRIGKTCRFDFSDRMDELKEVLDRLLRDFPEDMAREISDFILAGDSLEEEVQKGADILDLHNLEMADDGTALTDRDWVFLKELVNDYAADLDMEWVTYFMQFLIDRHIL